MLQIYTARFEKLNSLYDLQGTFMLSSVLVEKHIPSGLLKTGSSGYPGPGAPLRVRNQI